MAIRVLIVFLFLLGSLTAQTDDVAQAARANRQGQTQTKIDPAKEADIRHFMATMKVTSLSTQIMEGMTGNMKPMMMQSLPPGEYREKLIDLFFEKFRSKADPQQIIDMAVPIYDKYFTDEEIKGLTKFYETPLGQKAVTSLPQLMTELQQQGMKWGENLGRTSMQEVLAEHPDLADAMQAAALKAKMP